MNTLACLSILFFTNHIDAQFSEVSSETGINHSIDFDETAMGGGVVFFDFNNDGFEDIYLTGGKDGDQLFQNLGNGKFHDVSEYSGVRHLTEGLYTFGVISGDINNDGCADLFVTTFNRNFANKLFLNNCIGGFTDISVQAGIREKSASTSAAFIDLNKDGLLDIYVSNYINQFTFVKNDAGEIVDIERSCFSDFFYLNKSELKFEEVSSNLGLNSQGCGLAVISTDFDQDRDQDIYLANDHGAFVESNKLFENMYPDVECTNVAAESGTDISFYAMGIAGGDINSDGFMDYYITNLGDNALLISQAKGIYRDMAEEYKVKNGIYETGNKVVGWGTFFFDYDLDTDLDLYVSNGYIRAGYFDHTTQKKDTDVLYQNQGDETFQSISGDLLTGKDNINRGVAFGDYDRDGDPDIFSVSLVERYDRHSSLYKNNNAIGNWIAFTLEGTSSNRNAFGVILKLFTKDKIQMREVNSGGSHASQNSLTQLFGLADINIVDSLQVLWPSGQTQLFEKLKVNKYYHIIENSAEILIEGCTNVNSISYDPEAKFNTACYYEMLEGCTDKNALNYNPVATINNSSCQYTTAVTTSAKNEHLIRIYPNPASRYVYVELPEKYDLSQYRVNISSILGETAVEKQVKGYGHRFDISALKSGIYIAQVIDMRSKLLLDRRKLLIVNH